MIRVLVVDVRAAVRRSVRDLLESEVGTTVVAEANSGATAIRAIQRVSVDVALVGIRIPGGDDVTLTRTLSATPHNLPVVANVTSTADECLLGAIRAGAVALVLAEDRADYVPAIHAAAHGSGFFSAALRVRLFSLVVTQADPRAGLLNAHTDDLTPREYDVLRALCHYPSNNHVIAQRLNVEPATVKGHLKHIMTKLDLHSRADLVAWAFYHRIAAAPTLTSPPAGAQGKDAPCGLSAHCAGRID